MRAKIYFKYLISIFFILCIIYIGLIANFKIITKEERTIVPSIAQKILSLKKHQYRLQYLSYIKNFSSKEIYWIEKKGLNLEYVNGMYFFILSEGFDDYYYYNLTKQCWHDDITEDKYLIFVNNCQKNETYYLLTN